MRAYVEDVAEVAGTFDTPPVVVAHSMGGMVVQQYLEDHEAPGGVLVASGPPRGVIGITMKIARRHPLRFLRMNATWSLYPVVADPQDARDLLFSDLLDEATALGYVARVQDESYLAFLDMLVLDRPRPHRVTAPMLVVGGSRDAIFPPPEVHATASAYDTSAVMFERRARPDARAGWARGRRHDCRLGGGARRLVLTHTSISPNLYSL